MLHLFHPALVHFAVAFVVAGGSAELWGLLAGRERLERWGSGLLLLGAAALVPTIATGYLAANTVALPEGAAGLLGRHERTGWILFALLVATQFWKGWCGGRIPASWRALYVLGLSVAIGAAAYGAWLGGRLVYGRGVGVLAGLP